MGLRLVPGMAATLRCGQCCYDVVSQVICQPVFQPGNLSANTSKVSSKVCAAGANIAAYAGSGE